MSKNSKSNKQEGIIVEFISVGNSVKVTAFDPETLREASVIGSLKTSKQQLSKLAIRKLCYVLTKYGNA